MGAEKKKKTEDQSSSQDHKSTTQPEKGVIGSSGQQGTGKRNQSNSRKKKRSNSKPAAKDQKPESKERSKEKKETQGHRGQPEGVENTQGEANDPGWYYLTPAIGQDSASIPYNVFAGTLIRSAVASYAGGGEPSIDAASVKSIPSAIILQYIPGPGRSISITSAINIATKAIYAWVRHMNSGAKVYESADYGLYLFSLADVYSSYAEAKRMVRLASRFEVTNRSFPDVILRGMGIDSDDLRANIAQYRATLNILGREISSFAVPKEFAYFQRQIVLSAGVYGDSESIRGQVYIAVKHGRYLFNAATTSGGSLQYTPYKRSNPTVTTLTKFSEVLKDLEEQVTALVTNEDVYTMSGDTLKAYGEGELYGVSEIGETDVQEITFDENVLAQFENALSLNYDTASYLDSYTSTGTSNKSFDIAQRNGLIYYNPITGINGTAGKSSGIGRNYEFMNSHKDTPTWEENLEWSRFRTRMNVSGERGEMIFGSEITVRFNMVRFDPDDTRNIKVAPLYTYNSISGTSPDAVFQALTNAAMLATYDWHPFITWRYTNATGTATTVTPAAGDTKVVANVSYDTDAKMHDCALLGLWNARLLYAGAKGLDAGKGTK